MGKGSAAASQRLKLRLRLSSTAGIHLLVTDNGGASFTDQKILHRTFQAAQNFLVTSGYSSPAESVEEGTHHPTAVSDDDRVVEIASFGHHQSVDSDGSIPGVSSLFQASNGSQSFHASETSQAHEVASLENQAAAAAAAESEGSEAAVAQSRSSHVQAAEEEIAGRSLQSPAAQIQAEEGTRSLQYQAAAETAGRSLQSRAATECRGSQIQAAAAAECGSSEIQVAVPGRSSHIQAAAEDDENGGRSLENQASSQTQAAAAEKQSLHVQAADGASADIQAAQVAVESVSGSLQIQAGASVKIQAVYRGYKARRILLLQKAAARLIQAQTRGFLVTRMLHRWGVAASSIQAAYKRYNRQILLLQKNAVRLIQAHARGFLIRRMVNRWGVAARSIQQAWRLARKVSQLISSDVRKVARSLQQIQAATVKIQAVYRGHTARQSSLQKKVVEQQRQSAAVKIQLWYRGNKLRKYYLVQKNAVKLIQAYSRGFLIRQMVHRWGVAARLIQQAWKLSRESNAASQRQQVQQVVSSEAEDWNSFEVDRLGECLDTYLADIGAKTAGSSSGLNLPESSAHRDRDRSQHEFEACGYKQTLKERDLQQVARVFLLQHQISMQQQQAKHAPPFPPQEQQLNCSMIRREVSIQKPSIEPQQEHGGDVILDVQLLLEELQRRGYSPSSDSSLVFMELGRCEKQAVVGLKQINALLVVFVAVVIYTRSLCHGVILWAKQSATKK